jgi:hypothetical protein
MEQHRDNLSHPIPTCGFCKRKFGSKHTKAPHMEALHANTLEKEEYWVQTVVGNPSNAENVRYLVQQKHGHCPNIRVGFASHR